MKKIFLIICLSGFSLFLKAQSNTSFGLKAGLNVANVQIKNGEGSFDPIASFHLGALAHVHLTSFLAFQPEIMYSGQGAKASSEKLMLGNINIPVLVQYMAHSGFRVETGPQIGYLLTAKAEEDGDKIDVKDQFKKVDLSWVFGVGYVTPSGFGVDARYNLGISNISEEAGAKFKNRVFQAGFFYQFQGTSR